VNRKMMITGEVIKKPEHIELGKYNVTVRTNGGKELVVQIDSDGIDERLEIGMTAAFSAVMVDEVILVDKVSYSRKG
jgi:hypothetical protein